jgi:hypothetical protein
MSGKISIEFSERAEIIYYEVVDVFTKERKERRERKFSLKIKEKY